MAKDKRAVPFVKWAGGKRQLIESITPLLPKRISSYCEPFLGGGAVFFSIQPKKAVVNDLNQDLMLVYETIRDDVDALISSLQTHENTADYYYMMRDMDRDKKAYSALSRVEKASRLLYLNKTCFNGLFRVNSSGEFNTPFGHYKNPNIVNEPVLRAVSQYFSASSITFCSEDFSQTLERIGKGAFVYLDPPYDPLSGTANFTGYNQGGFGRAEQIRLKEACDRLTKRGVKFMLSNSATDFIRELYQAYDVTVVKAKRAINANARKRGAVEEVLIRNYSRNFRAFSGASAV